MQRAAAQHGTGPAASRAHPPACLTVNLIELELAPPPVMPHGGSRSSTPCAASCRHCASPAARGIRPACRSKTPDSGRRARDQVRCSRLAGSPQGRPQPCEPPVARRRRRWPAARHRTPDRRRRSGATPTWASRDSDWAPTGCGDTSPTRDRQGGGGRRAMPMMGPRGGALGGRACPRDRVVRLPCRAGCRVAIRPRCPRTGSVPARRPCRPPTALACMAPVAVERSAVRYRLIG